MAARSGPFTGRRRLLLGLRAHEISGRRCTKSFIDFRKPREHAISRQSQLSHLVLPVACLGDDFDPGLV